MRSLFLLSLVGFFQSSSALKILLTNEDGIDHPGLQILREALIEKGHRVSTFAPATDMTGMGGALDMPTVTVKPHGKLDQDMWAVHGFPSTALLIGLAKMDHEPDLIISGINVGYASGPVDIHSGAQGGVLTGLGKDIPAFSILTNLAEDIEDEVHFGHAAVFVCHLVDVLVDQMVVFPIGVGLKIGYPALLPKDIPKVVLAGYGHYNPFNYGYYPTAKEGVYKIGPAPSAQKYHADSDAVLVEQGNIGVLAITNDISLHRTEDNAYFLDDIAKVLAATDARWTRKEAEEDHAHHLGEKV